MKVLIYVSMYEELGVYGIGIVTDDVESMVKKDMDKMGENWRETYKIEKCWLGWSVEILDEGDDVGYYSVVDVE